MMMCDRMNYISDVQKVFLLICDTTNVVLFNVPELYSNIEFSNSSWDQVIRNIFSVFTWIAFFRVFLDRTVRNNFHTTYAFT